MPAASSRAHGLRRRRPQRVGERDDAEQRVRRPQRPRSSCPRVAARRTTSRVDGRRPARRESPAHPARSTARVAANASRSTPLPGHADTKSRDARRVTMPSSCAAARIALRQRMRRALFEARRRPQDIARASRRRAAITSVTTGRPSVSVPVLSTISVQIVSACSSAAALRIRMPDCAPRPVPTMIAVGVARPSAHGQAMTSTATALHQRRVRFAGRATTRDEGQRARSPRPPARTRRRPGRPGAGSAPSSPALRATRRMMPASIVAAPTPVASHVSRPSWLSVPANTSRAGSLARPAGSRRSACSRRRSTCPRARSPSTGMLSPGTHDEEVAGDDLASGTSTVCAVALDARRLRLQADQPFDARPTCRPWRALRAACRAAPA